MKQLTFFLFLVLAGINFTLAQNASSFTSPPNVLFDEQSAVLQNSDNLKEDKNDSGSLHVINGSFEKNNGFCIINGSNTYINNNVKSVNAFGCANEIDLMNNGCGYGHAYSGNYFLCLSNGQINCGDALTLKLSFNLNSGDTYTMSYFDRGYDVNNCCAPAVPLEVGISTTENAMGTIVYTSPQPKVNVWHQRVFTFIAPNNGQYISFHAKDSSGRWTHIDSVTIARGACRAPKNLAVTDVQSTTATLSWHVAASSINLFKIVYREKGTTTNWFEKENKKDTTATLTALSPNTTYEWQMRTFCDTSKSRIVYGDDFTTLSSGAKKAISLTPNPAKNFLKIDGLSKTGKTKLTVYDFIGNILVAASSGNKTYNLNIEKLKPGNYLLKIETAGSATSHWFMKQ